MSDLTRIKNQLDELQGKNRHKQINMASWDRFMLRVEKELRVCAALRKYGVKLRENTNGD